MKPTVATIHDAYIELESWREMLRKPRTMGQHVLTQPKICPIHLPCLS